MRKTDWNAIFDRQDAIFEITKEFTKFEDNADYLKGKINVAKALLKGENISVLELTTMPLPLGGFTKKEIKYIIGFLKSWLRYALRNDPAQIRRNKAADDRYVRKLGYTPSEYKAKFM